MTESENQLLTRAGPGTPMGNLLRQYWIPVLQAADLPENDGAPLRVRLLCENLVAFRNSDGQVGLIDHVCAHRGASLFFGRNEENGLRCLYHGWKFNIEGRCVDVPNEPPGSKFNEQIRITAYPCVERNGIVWTYMGPKRDNPPPLPKLGWAMVGPNRRGALRYQRACNWVQAMEGDFDSSHLSFLHLAFDPKLQNTASEKKAGIDYYRNIARMDKQPLLEVRETDVGVMYGARREADNGKFYWRVTQFMMPFYTSVPGFGGKNRDKVWVPLDDEHTMVWEPHWSATRELSEEEQKGWKDRVPPSGFLPNNDEWLGQFRFAANRSNDYFADRERQKFFNFSGLEDVTPIQDAAMQESMGPIVDRAREHLGASDAAIVRMRRRLINAARDLEKTNDPPPGVQNPALYYKHGDQLLLEGNDSWTAHYAAKMKTDYDALASIVVSNQLNFVRARHWNDKLLNPAPVPESIPTRFDRVASRFPQRAAISAPGAEWTYAELDHRSNALAVQILERSLRNSEPVALLMEHGGVLIAAILAVLKAGKIYLALDPNDSIERLAAVLADSRAGLLIADQKNAGMADSLTGEQLQLLVITHDFKEPSIHTNFPEVPDGAGAWLMYTSGSTGIPKAVWQNHRGIVHDASVYSELVQLTPEDRLSLLTSCSFAASSTPLFTALLNGATLCPFHVRSQGVERLAIWLRARGITIYHSVPTVFRHLVRVTGDNGVFARLRLVRLAGEPVLRDDVEIFQQRFPDHCRLMNALASTETGPISVSMFEKHTVLPEGRVPVGRAVRDVEIFLVNEQGRPVENSSDGRIAVRSAYLRQGYWRRPDETAEKFLMDPRAPGTRAFVTNDLGRFLPDGNLEHLGRVDRAVKIGGLRVDLSELEAALRATDLFQEVVVTTFQDISEGCRLVTYVVPRLEKDCSFPAGRQSLQQLLPVPSRFVILRELPLLANGKIDHAQLSEKTAQTLAKEDQAGSDASDALGLQLVRIWEKVLGLDAVGTTDDFFALGGDSLAAATMLAAVDKFCGVTLPTSALLKAPTIQKLADLIRSGGVGETDLRLVALRLRGTKPPLYCVPGAGSDALLFRILTRYLGDDQPVFAFQPQGLDGRGPYLRSVDEMANSYIDAMRLHQPRGPYYLCGASFGGVVAFDMARRLVADGEEVRFLGLLDAYGGAYPKPRRYLTPRKRLKKMLLRFLPQGSYTFTLAWLKTGLKEQMKRWFVRRMIALDGRMKFRALQCPLKLRIFYIQEICFAARRRYKLMPFLGKIDLFRAEHQPPSDLFEEDPLLGWNGMAEGGIEVHQLPGDHIMYLQEPVIAAAAAAQLGAVLNKRVAERTKKLQINDLTPM